MWKVALLLFAVLGASIATPLKDVYSYRYPSPQQEEPEEDPKPLEPDTFNLTLNPLLDIPEGSNHMGGMLSGHTQNTIDIGIIIITLALTFNIHIPHMTVELRGMADGSGYVDLRPLTSAPSGNFTFGGQDAHGDIQNLRVRGNAQLFINIIGNRVAVRTLNLIEFTFADICLDMGDMTIGEGQVDWTDFCANFAARFRADWGNGAIKDGFTEHFRVTLNNFVGQYTLDELIGLLP